MAPRIYHRGRYLDGDELYRLEHSDEAVERQHVQPAAPPPVVQPPLFDPSPLYAAKPSIEELYRDAARR